MVFTHWPHPKLTSVDAVEIVYVDHTLNSPQWMLSKFVDTIIVSYYMLSFGSLLYNGIKAVILCMKYLR